MKFGISFLPKWNLHISLSACPSLSPPNNIITDKNLTAQWLWRHPGPGLDLRDLHFRETKSNLHRSDFSWRSVMPPKIQRPLSWRTAVCLCLAEGHSEPPWEIKCHVSLSATKLEVAKLFRVELSDDIAIMKTLLSEPTSENRFCRRLLSTV